MVRKIRFSNEKWVKTPKKGKNIRINACKKRKKKVL